MYARIGYFEGFKGANTILVCGDDEGLQQLAYHLRTLEDATAEPVNLHSLPFVHVQGDVALTAHPANRELGVCRAGATLNFAWRHSEEGWLESAEQIEAIVRGSGGHCVLGETATGDAIVMISKGEYGEGWWERHGERLENNG
jgi:hypothetical protein